MLGVGGLQMILYEICIVGAGKARRSSHDYRMQFLRPGHVWIGRSRTFACRCSSSRYHYKKESRPLNLPLRCIGSHDPYYHSCLQIKGWHFNTLGVGTCMYVGYQNYFVRKQVQYESPDPLKQLNRSVCKGTRPCSPSLCF